jgi:hypothetical protein
MEVTMQKKGISILLVVVIACVLFGGCGGTEEVADVSETENVEVISEETIPEPAIEEIVEDEEAPEPEPVVELEPEESVSEIAVNKIDPEDIPEIVFIKVPIEEVLRYQQPELPEINGELVKLWDKGGNLYSNPYCDNFFLVDEDLYQIFVIDTSPGYTERRFQRIDKRTGDTSSLQTKISHHPSTRGNICDFEIVNSNIYYFTQHSFYKWEHRGNDGYWYYDSTQEEKIFGDYIVGISKKNDTVILGSGRCVFAIKESDANQLWSYTLPPEKGFIFDVKFENETLYISHIFPFEEEGKEFFEYNTMSGFPPYSFQQNIASIVRVNDTWLDFRSNYSLKCHDDSLNLLWEYERYDDSGGRAKRIRIKDGTFLFFKNKNNEIICLDIDSGKELWKTEGKGFSSFELTGNKLIALSYTGETIGKLQYIDTLTGETVNASHKIYDGSDIYGIDFFISDDLVIIGDSIGLGLKEDHKSVLIPKEDIIFHYTSDAPIYDSKYWQFETTKLFFITNNTNREIEFSIKTEETKYSISETVFLLQPGETKEIIATQDTYTPKTKITEEERENPQELLDNLKPILIRWEDKQTEIEVSFGTEYLSMGGC